MTILSHGLAEELSGSGEELFDFIWQNALFFEPYCIDKQMFCVSISFLKTCSLLKLNTSAFVSSVVPGNN